MAGDPQNPLLCPKCGERLQLGTFHQCYDPWSDSYFAPNVGQSPDIIVMRQEIQQMNQTLIEIKNLLRRIYKEV